MKCRSGDLAVIINNRFQNNLGAFVRVRKVAFVHGELGAFWSFDSASKSLMLGGYGDDRYDFIHARETTEDNLAYLRDADLQPIRGLQKKNLNTVDHEA